MQFFIHSSLSFHSLSHKKRTQLLISKRFTKKLPSHPSLWTRPVSHKLHGIFLNSLVVLYFSNQILAPLPRRERCSCFNKFCVFVSGTWRSRSSIQALPRRLANSVPLLLKVGNRISRNCFAKSEKIHWTTKTFVLQDILLAKISVFICHIGAISAIQHPCFKSTVKHLLQS